jgi:hypothetical protein
MQFGAALRPALKAAGLAILVILGLIVAGTSSAEPSTATPKIIEALDNVRNLMRPGQDDYATVWEGDKYVQCHALPDQSLFCETASATMQPSLERVLTSERKQRLTNLGWRLDPSFGAYTQVFAPTLTLDKTAERILASLRQGYDADLTFIEVQTRWVAHRTCPPRRGPGQNLAGLVDDSPMMAATALHGCAYSAPATIAASASGAADPGTSNLVAVAPPASSPGVEEVVAVEAATAPTVVATDSAPPDPAPVREPRERRARRPRSSSGRSRSTGPRRSRSGGHSSHHK